MKRRGFRVIVFSLVITSLILFYYQMIFRYVQLNSDDAYEFAEALDIVKGNFFLKGWIQGGYNFLTTEMPFMIAGVVLRGFSPGGAALGWSMMYVTILLCGILLIYHKNDKKFFFIWEIVFFLTNFIPYPGHADMVRWHAGAFIMFSMALFLWNNIKTGQSQKCKNLYVLIVVFQVFAFFGDTISLLTTLLPAMGVYIFRVIHDRNIKNRERTLCFLSIIGFIISFLLKKFYYLFGAIPYNSVENSKIESINKLLEKLRLLRSSLFFMYYKGCAVGGFYEICFNIFLIVVLALMILSVIHALLADQYDFVSTFLSVGIVLLSVAYTITTISRSEWNARYLSYFPIAFSVIIIRAIRNNIEIIKKIVDKYVDIRYVFAVSAIFCVVGSVMFRTFAWSDRIPNALSVCSQEAKLAYFLEEHNLTSGYGSYWHARINNLYTNGKVNVRQVRVNVDDLVVPYYWLCKKSWYSEDANFIIIDDELPAEVVERQFGEPDTQYCVKDAGRIVVYVYNRNLSGDILD